MYKDKECQLIATITIIVPLIRYNTEDQISNDEFKSGIMKSFRIINGNSEICCR